MNPYKVLGVSETATPEEIRQAYLELVKKYHPDKYTDNPLKELANEKLKEINEAYDTLTKKDKSSSASSSGGYSGYSGGAGSAYTGSGTYSGPEAQEFSRARAFISQGNLQAAKLVLDAIKTHNSEWYFLYGIIYLRQGWYDKANEFITRAYQMDPNNAEYRNVYSTLKSSGSPYGNGGGFNRTGGSSCSTCDICSGLICADCCCEACGGNLIPCCGCR